MPARGPLFILMGLLIYITDHGYHYIRKNNYDIRFCSCILCCFGFEYSTRYEILNIKEGLEIRTIVISY